ncbi:DUF1177 domain-containing protein [Candidatus Bathyarchaeota archaeon]|jgi:hypothetical protein|nr:DUF1177 domain-containing protein [Candidatus Bathyarchaeota archaeon]MBT4320770.1 DUF1177 domain-containing protein [Candidatus Bathyarchaeota archaeon]MBT4422948.1 DUF1177 domain-containing protein [Candidatus Bathyarchaeota archaeon]MBT6605076.1 DUF1177 domain-containing protein [Candidatus Bathyarchaeota archaeon]
MLKQVIEIMDLLDSALVNGDIVRKYLQGRGLTEIEVKTITGEKGSTDFVKIKVQGAMGKSKGGSARTMGIIGRLGGIGARPEQIGLVSDADGAIVALSLALKLADMKANGDALDGDVVISTHICPDAPVQPHKPVPFMGSPVDTATMNREEVDSEMDAILSVDTTKGNRVANWRGFAITATVKDGWILKVSDSLLDIMSWTTGEMPKVCPITTQDITPYGNDLYHINSIMQPCTATDRPVVGLAITSQVPVPGCGTGASHPTDIEEAARFALEVAKQYGKGLCSFYDEEEWSNIVNRYGDLKVLQTLGN